MWVHSSFTDLPTYILMCHVHKPLEISVPFALAYIYYCPAGNYSCTSKVLIPYPFRYHPLHWPHRLWRGHVVGRGAAHSQRQK